MYDRNNNDNNVKICRETKLKDESEKREEEEPEKLKWERDGIRCCNGGERERGAVNHNSILCVAFPFLHTSLSFLSRLFLSTGHHLTN